MVSVAVNSFVFKQPVGVGDMVSFYAEVVSVGNTSVTIDVEVFAEQNPADPRLVKVTEARLTYVAVDKAGASVWSIFCAASWMNPAPYSARTGSGRLICASSPADAGIWRR